MGRSSNINLHAKSNQKNTFSGESKQQLKIKNKKSKSYKSRSYDTLEDKAFVDLLTSQGLMLTIVDGDGNCLFRSLSDQLTGTQSNHHQFLNELHRIAI